MITAAACPLALAIAGLTMAGPATEVPDGADRASSIPRGDVHGCCATPPPPPPPPPPPDAFPRPAAQGAIGGRGAATPGVRAPLAAGAGKPSGTAFLAPRAGGLVVAAEEGRWTQWWAVHQCRFLPTRCAARWLQPVSRGDDVFLGLGAGPDAVPAFAPAATDRSEARATLAQILASEPDAEVAAACVLALGRVGQGGDPDLVSLRARLASPHGRVRESAALALGLSQQMAAARDLLHLLHDTGEARRLCGRESIDGRTRAAAALGLGLCARRAQSTALDSMVVDALRGVLEGEASRDLRIAAIRGLGLLQAAPPPRDTRARVVREAAAATLWHLAEYDRERGTMEVRAHALPALACLLGRGGARRALLSGLAQVLAGADRSPLERQGAAVALGMVAEPADVPTVEALQRAFASGRDPKTRYLALIALGEIGGERAREALLRVLETGSKALERPWAALALGVLESKARAGGARPDPEVARTLRRQLDRVKSPETLAAVAVALGLCGDQLAVLDLHRLLARWSRHELVAECVCQAFALLGAESAAEDMRLLVDRMRYRPLLLERAAVALACLGDRSVTTRLLAVLHDARRSATRLDALASAMTTIGDRRSLAPLLELAAEPSESPATRARAIGALGALLEPDPIPWHARVLTGSLVGTVADIRGLTLDAAIE